MHTPIRLTVFALYLKRAVRCFTGDVDSFSDIVDSENAVSVLSIPLELDNKRDALIAEFAERKGHELIVKKDVSYNTPSGAAAFCVGGSANGWTEWRDETIM